MTQLRRDGITNFVLADVVRFEQRWIYIAMVKLQDGLVDCYKFERMRFRQSQVGNTDPN